jgi:hypothetical protein
MARSSSKHEGFAGQQEAVAASGHDDVAVLGKPPSTSEAAVHPEGQEEPCRPTGPVNTANVLRLLKWQGFRCALSGRPLMPDTASLDHIVPVRDGGEHTIENVQALHKDVNRAKSTLAHEQFIQLCREVVEHVAAANTEGDSP